MTYWKSEFNVAGSFGMVECFEFKISIENFSKFNGVDNSLNFMTTRGCHTTWQIVLEMATGSKKMRIALKRSDCFACNVKGSIFFEIKNDLDNIFWRDWVEHLYNSQNSKNCYCDYIDLPTTQNCVFGINGEEFKLSSDKLIIKGEVLIKEHKIGCSKHEVDSRILNDNLNVLKCNYKNLYYNHKFSDIEIRFKEGTLFAHKNILSSRSPVFEKMLELNLYLAFIDINDVEESVFEIFLLYLYCGIIENRDTNVIMSVYELAKQYEVQMLSRNCISILASNMSSNSVVRILELANRHDDSILKDIAIDFLCENFSLVAHSFEWYKFIGSNPYFASCVLQKVSDCFKTANNNKLT